METVGKTANKGILKTGIAGFDDVLCGGLNLSVGRAMSIVIKGPHGAGKTTFGLQFASNFFNSMLFGHDGDQLSPSGGRSVAFFSLEQRAEDMKTSMSQFDWQPIDFNHVLCQEDFTQFPTITQFPTPESVESPMFFIGQFPQTALDAMEQLGGEASPGDATVSSLTEYVRMVVEQMKDCGLIVIDSISDPFDDELNKGSYRLNRTLFQELCAIGEEFGATVVILLEKNNGAGWRDFVPDMVVELGWQELPNGDLRRFLQVEKGRFQEILDGRHELRIEPGRGIVVNPILSAVLRRAAGELRKHPRQMRSVPFCVNTDFNRILGAEYGGKILEGSSTLLYGPDATRKKAIVTQFLHQGVLDTREEGGHVLFLIAGSTEGVARKTLCQYLDKKLVEDAFFDVASFMSHVVFFPVSGFFETINELAHEIGELIAERNICRIAFDDVAAFLSNPKEVLPIKEYCSLKGVTSLFVETTEPGTESSIREHFDTFMRSRHLILPNGVSSRIGYQVKNVDGSSKSSGRSWELEFNDGRLFVRDSFREYVEDREGHLHLLPLRLTLFCEYPEMEKFWEKEAHEMFETCPNGIDDKLQTFVAGGFERHLESFDIMANRFEMVETRAYNVDEFAFDHLVANNRLEGLDAFAGTLEEPGTSKFHPLAWKRGQVDNKQYGIPHRLDFGIYTVRTDILQQLGLDPNKSDWTWNEMIEVGERAQSSFLYTEESDQQCKRRMIDSLEEGVYPSGKTRMTMPSFDFFAGADESFLSYVLEVLWPFLFDGDLFRGFDHPDVEKAVFCLRKVLIKMGALPGRNKAGAQDIVPAVFQRHWFVTFWEMQKRFPEHARNLRFIKPPKLQLDKDSEPLNAATISGEWFLALLSGSPNPGRGMWAIRALTSKMANQRFHHERVGLPAVEQQFEKAIEAQQRELYKLSKSRRQIPNYFENRYILLEAFRTIFSHGHTPDENSIRNVWQQMLKEIQ